MNTNNLKAIVQNLLSLGREGGYWDFKEKWHENKAELLLDIICMANNMENRDAYIFFGIQNSTMKVVGVESDPNRKKLNDLSQFVAGKNFDVYTPEVDLQEVEMEEHIIDILIVGNTNHTPYYLKTDFSDNKKTINHGNVYVRLNDRKAGVDTAAPYSCIEHLWEKRFGINLSIMERLSLLLDDPTKWKHDWGNKKYAFHENFPEFRLQQHGEMQDGWIPAAAFYIHPSMYLTRLDIMYHNTVIYETEIWCFDEFRKYLPKARNSGINGYVDFWYSYYDLSTIEGKLLTIFTNGTNDISSREPNYHQILVFSDASDKEVFNAFFEKHFNDIPDEFIKDKYRCQIVEDTPVNGGGLIYSAFHVAKAAELYSIWITQKNKRAPANT
jgi:hypothetical protein